MDLFNMRLSPAAQKSPDELDILAAMILDDLVEERWTSERFALACRKHRKISSFLPTTADLLAADKALAEATPCQEFKALPAWDTPVDEQAAKNQARARDLLAALSGGKRPDWAKRVQ
jgi:hypothetical protein